MVVRGRTRTKRERVREIIITSKLTPLQDQGLSRKAPRVYSLPLNSRSSFLHRVFAWSARVPFSLPLRCTDGPPELSSYTHDVSCLPSPHAPNSSVECLPRGALLPYGPRCCFLFPRWDSLVCPELNLGFPGGDFGPFAPPSSSIELFSHFQTENCRNGIEVWRRR